MKVVAAIIVNENRILATQRAHGSMRGYWEFPGGKVEPQESLLQALQREICEELATKVNVGSLFRVINYQYEAIPDGPRARQAFDVSLHCFFCTLAGPQPTLLEHQNARWLARNELFSVEWLPADVNLVKDLQESSWVV